LLVFEQVEVPHTDLSKVTRMVLVEVRAVVVLFEAKNVSRGYQDNSRPSF
jgi:hypothetical protein